MGELGALFNPGMRHELEERRSKAARREEEGNARDGDLRIDLESGVAVINMPADTGDADPDADDVGADPAVGLDAGGESDAPRTPVRSDSTPPASGRPETSAPRGNTQDTDPDRSSPVVEPAKQPTTAVRPRGKRGMSTSTR